MFTKGKTITLEK